MVWRGGFCDLCKRGSVDGWFCWKFCKIGCFYHFLVIKFGKVFAPLPLDLTECFVVKCCCSWKLPFFTIFIGEKKLKAFKRNEHWVLTGFYKENQ